MARSSYLRSLSGPPPGSASLLRPPQVSPWARPRVMEIFGQETNPPISVSELSISGLPTDSISPAVSPRSPVDSQPATEQHFQERESPLAAGPQSVRAKMRPVAATVHAEPLQVMNPIRPNKLEHTGENASAESTRLDVSIAPGPSEPKTGISATVTDFASSARTNPPVASPATTAPDKDTTRKIPQGWKGKLWANDEELLQSAGNPRKPPLPRIPLLPVNEVQAPTAKAEDERKSNSVHIGRVEIHVTPPPAPVPRQQPARAAVGGGGLSRGFTSPFGFNQG
jgi:hypothetical protein